jgi:membrane protease subunit HflK
MNLHPSRLSWAGVKGRVRGMFNLNDPRWGRGDDKPADENRPEGTRPDNQPPSNGNGNNGPRGQGPNQGPPDLDELWRDFNRKLGGLFGGARNGAVLSPEVVGAAWAAVASSPT